MKKPILLAICLLLLSSNVFAKTEGSYIGLDIISAKSSYSEGSSANIYNIESNDNVSFGVNYRYALNFNDFILAPEVFYDHLGLEMLDVDSDEWRVNSRSGVKLNLGYDLTDDFAILVNGGFARTSYEVDWKSVGSYRQDVSDDLIYGFILKYSISDNVDISLAQDISTIQMAEPSRLLASPRLHDIEVKTTKLGASYKF